MEDNYEEIHKPVLLNEILAALKVEENAHLKNQACYIDATLGLGGHTVEIVKRGGKVLGIDADTDALEIAQKRIKTACPATILSPSETDCGSSFIPFHGNFKDIEKIAKETGFKDVEGILFDLGVSSPQLTSQERGFSFRNEAAVLDMRLDKENQTVKACDLLNVLSKSQLNELFLKVLDYNFSQRITTEIVRYREKQPIKNVGEFLKIIDKANPNRKKNNPATLPFMAIRMAVNSELENLNEALPKAQELLKSQGRLAVISFHSGEDAIVKHIFKSWEITNIGKIINKEPILPNEAELSNNPRSRSSKLRIFEKI
jgi:16S rRNA (cytosine1402-N4)-methyltransferase